MKTRTLVLVGVLVALVLSGAVSFYASASPDGLERVSQDHGFHRAAKDSAATSSPMADYSIKGVSNARLSGGIAGVSGTMLVLTLAGGGFWLLRRRDDRETQDS